MSTSERANVIDTETMEHLMACVGQIAERPQAEIDRKSRLDNLVCGNTAQRRSQQLITDNGHLAEMKLVAVWPQRLAQGRIEQSTDSSGRPVELDVPHAWSRWHFVD